MAEVIDDEYMVCGDCLMPIVYDDFSSLDFHYKGMAVDQRRAEITYGMSEAGGHIMCGDSEKDLEYSTRACDCCGSPLAGSRHHMVVLG